MLQSPLELITPAWEYVWKIINCFRMASLEYFPSRWVIVWVRHLYWNRLSIIISFVSCFTRRLIGSLTLLHRRYWTIHRRFAEFSRCIVSLLFVPFSTARLLGESDLRCQVARTRFCEGHLLQISGWECLMCVLFKPWRSSDPLSFIKRWPQGLRLLVKWWTPGFLTIIIYIRNVEPLIVRLHCVSELDTRYMDKGWRNKGAFLAQLGPPVKRERPVESNFDYPLSGHVYMCVVVNWRLIDDLHGMANHRVASLSSGSIIYYRSAWYAIYNWAARGGLLLVL
jgi:hypothetical protein